MNPSSAHDLLSQALQTEKLGRFDEARDLLRQVVASADPAPAQESRLRLGRLLVSAGENDFAEAEAVLGAARTVAEALGAQRQAARAIHLLALLERRRRRPDAARHLLEQSPALRLAGAPGPEAGQYFHYRGLVAADGNELAEAERLLFRAYQFYDEANHRAGIAEVCDSLANLLLKRGKSRRAFAFAERSLELKRALLDRYGEAISLGTLGRAFLLQARYSDARSAFEQDLAIASELKDRTGIGIMLNSLGEVAILLRDSEHAASLFKRSLSEGAGRVNSVHAEMGLARALLASGQLEEASAAAARAESVLAGGGLPPALNAALTGIHGCLACRRNQASDGERFLTEAIVGLRVLHCDLDTIPYLYELRDLLHTQGRTQEAVRVMATALELLSECGAECGVRDVEEWLRRVDSPALVKLVLERHFPDYLVENILAGQLARQPSRRQEIAVLFSDIRDYTTLVEGRPAEEVVELLNEWFTEATKVVRRHGGVVEKFIGDALMVTFGVPEPRPDAAADAVRAAMGLRDAVVALNLRNRALGGREIRIGVGVATGEAVVGFIGSHLRQSYAAVGDVVNTAARLEGATKELGCDIIINQAAEEAQRPFSVAETEFLGSVRVKGKQNEVAVYSVLGPLSKPLPSDP